MADDPKIGSDDGSGGGEGRLLQDADPLEPDPDEGSSGGKASRGADPRDFGAIEAAVNEASKRLNAVWVSFILLMTYLFITTGKITQKDLFLETSVKLPILNVDVPLIGYFIAAPLFILAVHFYFLIQLRGLATKFGEYDAVLSELPAADLTQTERLRHRIDNSIFAQILGGQLEPAAFFLRLVAVLTAAMLPILLLLFIQLTFLAYQNVTMTRFHRGVIIAGVLMIMYYFVVALLSARSAFPPVVSKKGLRARSGNLLLVLLIAVVLASSETVSWYIAVLPSERSDFPDLTQAWFEAEADPVHQGQSSWFSNRLVLPDQNLIEGFDLDKVKVTRSLRGRHFVKAIFDRADLRQADFTGADLHFASLQGTKLEKANFGCAFGASSAFGCTKLQEARLDGAEMQGASLEYANLMGASLDNVNLRRANLYGAQLQGASLKYAQLDAASLASAGMDGVDLFDARLTATSFLRASVRGANFTEAWMFGAVFDSAMAHHASFEKAEMQGALLQYVNFTGAKFNKTSVFGANVSEAQFSSALIKDVSTARKWPSYVGVDYSSALYDTGSYTDPFGKEGDIVDLGSYSFSPYPGPVEIPAAEQDRLRSLFPNGLPEDPLRTEIKKRLAGLAPNSKTADWKDTSITEDEYKKGLGERLIIIACAKAGEGHVARGLIRAGRLCPYSKEVEAVLKSGMIEPSGNACEDVEGLRRIWSEQAAQMSTVCKQQDARQQ